MYLDCLDFIEKKSKVGIDLPKNDNDEQMYTPILRALDCVKFMFEGKLNVDEYFAFKYQIENQKIVDPKKLNK